MNQQELHKLLVHMAKVETWLSSRQSHDLEAVIKSWREQLEPLISSSNEILVHEVIPERGES